MKPATRKGLIKRYWLLIAAVGCGLVLWLVSRQMGSKMINVTLYSLKEMIIVIPPIFIILGLLDVWVPREQMVRFLGEGSGVKGILLAIFIGSAAAGPLYGAFPVAQVFLKKGASFRNVMILLGAWSTTKIPLLLFELASMGLRFTVTRLIVDMAGILIIALLMEWLIKEKDREEIRTKVWR